MADKSVCKIEGCGKPVLARGWCNSHYKRWREYSDPLAGGTSLGEPARYFREVVLSYDGSDCLIWPYAKDGPGYAKLWLDGSVKTVSRLVCEHFKGPPPTPQHEAAHSCGNGNGGCVAKKHLRWATSVENKADKIGHGTTNRGERQGAHKLTEADVRQIRSMCGSFSQSEIAKQFGIDQSTVSDIHRRKRWGWLD
jgi:hypothetical protein